MLPRRWPVPSGSVFDLLLAVVLCVGGLAYHWDYKAWGVGWVGDAPYGDAMFWWNGALNLAEGNVRDNPGQGMRPGYFVAMGAATAALGPQISPVHKLLLANFLAASLFLYLALRRPLGRPAAACAVALMVFNPFTAEWLSTTTTDGLGMVLHLFSLGCLVVGVGRGLHRGWLCAFGVAFALGTLTRPLITPFIGVAALALLLLPQVPWRRRALAVLGVVVGFAVPTFAWMATQRVLIGEWSISNNDASAVYAASDPNIMVWNPNMYVQVSQSAQQHLHVAEPTLAQINEEFWRLTVQNYGLYYPYHFQRFLPILWGTATFSPAACLHPTQLWQSCFLFALAAVLCLRLWLRKQGLRGLVVLAAGSCLWLSPHMHAFMTCAGAVLAFTIRPGREGRLPLLLLAGYWLTGVAALFLVGGFYSPGGAPQTLNALGYRLGMQVFFAGDLLAALFLYQLASLEIDPLPGTAGADPRRGWLLPRLAQWLAAAPVPAVGYALLALLGLVAAADASVAAFGGAVIVERSYAHSRGPKTPYPDLAPVVAKYRSAFPERDAIPWFVYPAGGSAGTVTNQAVAGSGSEFVWNMPGTERADLWFLPKKRIQGFPTGGFEVEVPFHVRTADWACRRGAVLLRTSKVRDQSAVSSYLQCKPSLLGFIPLSADESGYDWDRAVWYPQARYAAQLDGAGDFQCRGADLRWRDEEFRRRLYVVPHGETAKPADAVLTIDLSRACGARKLSFGRKWALEPTLPAGGDDVTPSVEVVAVNKETRVRQRLRFEETTIAALRRDCPEEQESFDVTDPAIGAVEIRFAHVPAGAAAWVNELNLQADDFRP